MDRYTDANSKVLAVFVIERILQVIGECLKKEPDADFNVKWFLSLYIPKSIRELFRNLRNDLSHIGKNHRFMKKIGLEKNMNLFKNIQNDINNMYEYLQPLLSVMNEIIIVYIKEKLLDALDKMKASEDYREAFKSNITKIIESILDKPVEYFYTVSFDDLIGVSENILDHLEEHLEEKKKEVEKANLESFAKSQVEKVKSSIKKMLQPLEYLIKLLLNKLELLVERHEIKYMIHKEKATDLIRSFKTCIKQFDLSSLIGDSELLIVNFKSIISQIRSPNVIKLNYVESTEEFSESLNSFSISDTEIEEINQYFHAELEDDVSKKEKLIQSIKENFILNKDELEELDISYLFPNEWEKFLHYYKKKKGKDALKFLEKEDPVKKLEDIFQKNYVKKKELNDFCRRFSLPEGIKEKLEKFRRKGNRLSHLLDRIKNLEIIFIGEENDVSVDMRKNGNPWLEEFILNRYMEDRHIKLATEMLVLDCLNLFTIEVSEWEKPCGLFQEIDLRHFIAHEDIIIRNICEWFDPSDLPENIVYIVTDILKDKNAIIDILTLYGKANENYSEFLKLLDSEGKKWGLNDDGNVTFKRYNKYVVVLDDANE